MTLCCSRRWMMAVAVFAICAASASADVIVIDPSVPLPPAQTGPHRAMQFEVALLRFLPRDKKRTAECNLATNAPLSQLIATLGKQGQVNVLFVGNRELCGAPGVPVLFDSSDRRPAFSLDKATNDVLTNRLYGLTLSIRAWPRPNDRRTLNWDGRFAWSPTLVDYCAGEKYLQFGFRIAALLKPGMVFEDADDDDDDVGRGINIGTFFKKKKQTKATLSPERVSYLLADRQEVPLNGRGEFANNEERVHCLPTPDGNEFVYFALRPVW